MDHAQEVSILKALMKQLDEGKNFDAGVQYRVPTKNYVCAQQAEKEWGAFFRRHPQLIGLSGDLRAVAAGLTGGVSWQPCRHRP